MTFGWRKFSTEGVAESPERELKNYDYLKICNLGPLSDVNLSSDASPDVISLQVNDNREAILYFDSLDPDVRQIMIQPDKNLSQYISSVRIEFPENKDYTNRAKLLANFPTSITPDLPFTSCQTTRY